MQYLWKPKKSLLEKVIKKLKAYLKRLHQGPKWHSKWNLLRKDRTSDREILKCLQAAVKQIHSSNDRVQLLSVIFAKDNDNKYINIIAQLLKSFLDMSKHLIKKATMYAAGGLAGIPIEAGKYAKKRLIDAQVNHFLDFLQLSGVMQDVTSGTRTAKLTSGRKVIMPNIVRTIHKSEKDCISHQVKQALLLQIGDYQF